MIKCHEMHCGRFWKRKVSMFLISDLGYRRLYNGVITSARVCGGETKDFPIRRDLHQFTY